MKPAGPSPTQAGRLPATPAPSLPTIPLAPPSVFLGFRGEIKVLQSKAPGRTVSSLKPVSLPQGLPSSRLRVPSLAAREATGLLVEWESDLRLLRGVRSMLGGGRGPQTLLTKPKGQTEVITAARTKSADFEPNPAPLKQLASLHQPSFRRPGSKRESQNNPATSFHLKSQKTPPYWLQAVCPPQPTLPPGGWACWPESAHALPVPVGVLPGHGNTPSCGSLDPGLSSVQPEAPYSLRTGSRELPSMWFP